MSKVLVLGGAGYIGSTVAHFLSDRGHEITIFDDFSTGREELVLKGAKLYRGSLLDPPFLQSVLASEHFDCVMHFAAKALVSESVQNPNLYYATNVEGTRNLLEAMASLQIRNVIFSSTCAVFGDHGQVRISEGTVKVPQNPYGETKLKAEQLFKKFSENQGLRCIILRYFNAAGAESKLRCGEWHEPETHLIPSLIRSALGEKELMLFGNELPTLDGTAVRDFIHVEDLAQYHFCAFERLLSGSVATWEDFNLGSEAGFSVKQVLGAWAQLGIKDVAVKQAPKRPGDPPFLVADSSKAKRFLGHSPEKTLNEMLLSAYQWEMVRLQKASAQSSIFT